VPLVRWSGAASAGAVIDDGLVKRDHFASEGEAKMYNIFWIIGVIVVVLAVLSFLGFR
jgi:hypothetical protein